MMMMVKRCVYKRVERVRKILKAHGFILHFSFKTPKDMSNLLKWQLLFNHISKMLCIWMDLRG